MSYSGKYKKKSAIMTQNKKRGEESEVWGVREGGKENE